MWVICGVEGALVWPRNNKHVVLALDSGNHEWTPLRTPLSGLFRFTFAKGNVVYATCALAHYEYYTTEILDTMQILGAIPHRQRVDRLRPRSYCRKALVELYSILNEEGSMARRQIYHRSWWALRGRLNIPTCATIGIALSG